MTEACAYSKRALFTVALVGTLITAGAAASAERRTPTVEPPPILHDPAAKSAASTRAPAAGRQSLSTPEDLIVRLINMVRVEPSGDDASVLLPPLRRSSQLDAAALGHSIAMSDHDFVAHCNPLTWQTPPARMQAAGYLADVAGETLVAGYVDPWDLVGALTDSPDNSVNLEWLAYREVGVGYVYDGSDLGTVARDLDGDCYAESTGWGPYYAYWTLVFGRRDDVYPVVIDREATQASDRFVSLYLYGKGWASEMRLRNESGTWTAWQPFASDVDWELTPGEGLREVFVEIRDSFYTVRSASDTIYSVDGVAPIFSDGFESGDLTAWGDVVGL